jgi:hypothetical protein
MMSLSKSVPDGLSSLTNIGPYMAHRVFFASLELHNFSNFCPFFTFDSYNVDNAFNWNSGVSVRVREGCTKDVSRGSLMGLEIV